jgi:ATP-dependent RNA helicase RhlE
VLVFCGTRIGANRLAHQLRKTTSMPTRSTATRRRPSAKPRWSFKRGKTAVLVATDVASRGLDIESLPQVINFDIPHSPRITCTASAAPARAA